MPNGPRVVYIAGSPRSGSTLLDNALGELPGVFSAGELRLLWRRAFLEEGRRCGCGDTLLACAVWSGILELLEEELSRRSLTPADIVGWQETVVRSRHMWGMPLPKSEASSYDTYAELLRFLYETIARVTGSVTIVDSSKLAPEGDVLRSLHGLESSVIQLVRDPRAVAYSRQRVTLYRDGDGLSEMAKGSAARSTFTWLLTNLGAATLRKRWGRGRSTLVRYEDLMAEPERLLSSIAASIGEPLRVGQEIISGDVLNLTGNHSVAGNPSRYRTGPIELREDDEWRAELPPWDRRTVTLMSLPVLLRYGYKPFDGGKRRAGGVS